MSSALSVGLNVANMEWIGNSNADFDYFKLYSTPLQPTPAPTEYPSTSPTPTPSTSGQPTPTPTKPVPQPLMSTTLAYLGVDLGAVFMPVLIGLLFVRRKRGRSSIQTATSRCKNCGYDNLSSSDICGRCGTLLREEKTKIY
jgi:hypothetical protein